MMQFVMQFRPEVIPYLWFALGFGIVVALLIRACVRKPQGGPKPRRASLYGGGIVTVVFISYFLYFFRDPERTTPVDADSIIAAADGKTAAITVLNPSAFLKMAKFSGLKTEQVASYFPGEVIRVSIFLSLFDVHVNRAPISGKSRFLGYFPGRHIFTFDDKSSEFNQHNSILFVNDRICCLLNQIVGPVARRVVYWPDHDKDVDLTVGDRIGMMKFGSRLDMYFPADRVMISTKVGDKVRAGETIIGTIK
jgi:phosphatidylserine decarboxylase